VAAKERKIVIEVLTNGKQSTEMNEMVRQIIDRDGSRKEVELMYKKRERGREKDLVACNSNDKQSKFHSCIIFFVFVSSTFIAICQTPNRVE